MKAQFKTLIFFLLTSVCLLSCKKEADPLAAEKELIIGNWTTTSQLFSYYNSTGSLVYSVNGQTGNSFNFKDNTVTESLNTQTDTYTFFKVAGSDKYSLNFNGNNVSSIKMFDVYFTGTNVMFWTIDSTKPGDVQYIQNGVSKTAAKVTIGINLKRM